MRTEIKDFRGHEPILQLEPSYDMSVGAAYLSLCSCPIVFTTSHMDSTDNALNLDYSSTLEEGLHPVGVELLNVARFDFLEADLSRLGFGVDQVEKVVAAFSSTPPN